MEVLDIENTGKQLVEFWQKQKILSPPNTWDDILHFEFSRSIQLPGDFRQLFLMTNGMVNLFPNYFDEEGYLFYPLEELTTLEEELDISNDSTVECCLFFAEYMHKSWWYAVRFSKGSDDYEICIVTSADKIKVITRSLEEFIQLYMKDDSILYEYL